MLIPRTIMTGVLPEQEGVLNVNNAAICSCPEPSTRLRKNIVVKQLDSLKMMAKGIGLDVKRCATLGAYKLSPGLE